MTAKGFVFVAKVSDLQNGTMKAFPVDGRMILIAMITGKLYAADNKCPHLGGNLSMGHLDGTVVTCPRHASQFDLVDGKVLRWTNWTGVMKLGANIFRPARRLHTYPVKVEGGNILVGI